MDRVKGKVAIITGAGRGIGAAAARLLAKEGARVAILEIDDANAKKVSDAINTAGGEAVWFHADIRREAEVKKAIDAVWDRWGAVNIMVNNACKPGGRREHIDLPQEEFDAVIGVKFYGMFYCNKYATEYMKKSGGGSIVNVASCYGIIGCDTPIYDASNGAMRAMTKSEAIVYAKYNIRSNSVHPGNIHTELFEELVERIGGGLEYTEKILGRMVPMNRMGTPEEIASGILFLASDESSFMTGAELVMDGGLVNAPPPVYPEGK
jgi:NAD(P)-dependent dehydrogenase (short-subunit alcohol dehydrogenase family)